MPTGSIDNTKMKRFIIVATIAVIGALLVHRSPRTPAPISATCFACRGNGGHYWEERLFDAVLASGFNPCKLCNQTGLLDYKEAQRIISSDTWLPQPRGQLMLNRTATGINWRRPLTWYTPPSIIVPRWEVMCDACCGIGWLRCDEKAENVIAQITTWRFGHPLHPNGYFQAWHSDQCSHYCLKCKGSRYMPQP
jgi:hypothetical protein